MLKFPRLMIDNGGEQGSCTAVLLTNRATLNSYTVPSANLTPNGDSNI